VKGGKGGRRGGGGGGGGGGVLMRGGEARRWSETCGPWRGPKPPPAQK